MYINYLQYIIKNINIEKMRGGWQTTRHTDKDIDFQQLFAKQIMTTAKFLNIDNIIGHLKDQKAQLTKILINNDKIIKDLFQICLTPSRYNNIQISNLTIEHTNKAFQIIYNMQVTMLGNYLLNREYVCEGRQREQEQGSIVGKYDKQGKCHKQVPAKIIYNILPLKYLFAMLEDSKPIPQTCLGYLYRIGHSLCYQLHKQFFNIFISNRQLTMLIFSHFYSNSIYQWFTKLLQIQCGNGYHKSKIQLFKLLIASMEKQSQLYNQHKHTYNNEKIQQIQHRQEQNNNYVLWLDTLQHYYNIMCILIQKMDDHIDKTMYTNINKQIMGQKYSMQFILARIQYILVQYQDSPSYIGQLNILLKISMKYLQMDSSYNLGYINKINNSINQRQDSKSSLSLKDYSNSNNNSNQLQDYNDTSVQSKIIINSQVVLCIRKLVRQLVLKIIGDKSRFDKVQFIISLLELIRIIIIKLQAVHGDYLQVYSTPQFIQYLLDVLTHKKNCTILHNIIKDIIILLIIKNNQSTLSILLNPNKTNYITILQQITYKQNKYKIQYQNQIYHIFQIASKRSNNFGDFGKQLENIKDFKDLEKKINQIKEFYTRPIKEKQSKQESQFGYNDDQYIENLITLSHDEKKLNQDSLLSPNQNFQVIEGRTQHWFDCGGLPIDSDQSKDELDSIRKSSQNISQAQLNQKKDKILQQQNQLKKQFKNIGVTIVDQITIKIPTDLNVDSIDLKNIKYKKDKIKFENSPTNNKSILKDKGQLQLQNQIETLQKKRLQTQKFSNFHQEHLNVNNNSTDYILEQQKSLDSLKQGHIPQISRSIQNIFQTSTDKDKKNHNSSSFQSHQVNNQENLNLNLDHSIGFNKQKINNQQNLGHKKVIDSKQDLTNPFPTYLQYQIDAILQQLD